LSLTDPQKEVNQTDPQIWLSLTDPQKEINQTDPQIWLSLTDPQKEVNRTDPGKDINLSRMKFNFILWRTTFDLLSFSACMSLLLH